MEFNFPDNKTIYFGTIQNYLTRDGKVLFNDINILDPKDNLIEIEGVSYFFTYLNGAISGNKGGNSILLKLYRTDLIDPEDVKYEEPTLILKVSRCKKTHNPKWIKKNERRFLKEIEALIACNDKKFQNIIKIFDQGICYIKNSFTDNFEPHVSGNYKCEISVNRNASVSASLITDFLRKKLKNVIFKDSFSVFQPV